jgi:4-hydroxy-tetrahydrodipicolinate reductase
MGQLVVQEVRAAGDLALEAQIGRLEAASLADSLAGADVVIDFSTPEALAFALPFLKTTALVSGTTGLPETTHAALGDHARRAPVLHSPNFSTGVVLLRHLTELAARALPDFDIEIVEMHHRNKQDAPSGTALGLAQAAAAGRAPVHLALQHGREGRTGIRPASQIGMHALRGGDVVGDHTVWFAGSGERISVGHAASSRTTFAAGAVRAARWLAGRAPGLYSMDDVLGFGGAR